MKSEAKVSHLWKSEQLGYCSLTFGLYTRKVSEPCLFQPTTIVFTGFMFGSLVFLKKKSEPYKSERKSEPAWSKKH